MSHKVMIEIDDTALNAALAKLQSITVSGGVAAAPSKVTGASVPRGGIMTVPRGEESNMLPSIPRGLRTTIGQYPSGYGMVSQYQKGLWLQRGILDIQEAGVSMVALANLYTSFILVLVDVLRIIDEVKAREEQHKQDIIALSDIHNSLMYKEWEKVQNNPYRGRRG